MPITSGGLLRSRLGHTARFPGKATASPTWRLTTAPTAQAVACALRKPFVGIRHHEALEAKLLLVLIGRKPGTGRSPRADFESFQPNVSLIVSGGHTMLGTSKRLRVKCVTASGGVTCNRALRGGLSVACEREGLALRLAEENLCTDNAVTIGILAERKLLQHRPPTEIDAEIVPSLAL